MNEKASDLIRERQDLDIFLVSFMERDSTSVLSADVTPPEIVTETQAITVPEQEPTLDKGALPELAIETPPRVSAETPAASTVTEPAFESRDHEEVVYPQEEKQTAVDDKLSAEIEEVPADDDAAVIPTAAAVAEESLPEDISREQEQQPVTSVSDRLSLDIPDLVMEERDSASTEIREEEERRPETASAFEAEEPVPLVLEERVKPVVDLQQAEEEPSPEPRREEIAAVSEEAPPQILTSGQLPEHETVLTLEETESAPAAVSRKEDELPADSKEITQDEPPEKALPAFIIRKEAIAESRRTQLDLDKTLDLQKSAPAAEEPKSEPEITDDKKINREEEVFGKAFKAKPEKPPTRSWVRAGVLFAIFAAMSAGYFGLYPDAGQQTIRWMASNIPYFDRLVETDRKPVATVYHQIKFTDIKQRFVYNVPLGRNIRIVEGNAVNQTTFPVSAIKILGELYDSHGSVLTSKVSYCGNVLSDEKLSSLGEAEIVSALSIPQGSDLSNSKVLPQNQVPFMIVFTSEPAGVVRTTIMPISFAGVSP